MSIDIKLNEDLEKCELTLSVHLRQRKTVSHDRVYFKWSDAQSYVKENYSPSKGYIIGECADKLKVADNDSPKQLSAEWVFPLIKEQVKKQVRKKSTTSTTTRTGTKSARSTSKKKEE